MTTLTYWRELCAELLEALEIQLDELASTNRLCKRARAALAQPEAESSITFNESRDSEVMRVDQRGFHYRGELIEDAGLAHRLMVTYLQRHTLMHPEVVEQEAAQPEPEGPTDEELTLFAVEWWASFAHLEHGADTATPINEIIHSSHFVDFLKDALRRFTRPAIEPEEPIPESELADMWNQQADLFNQWESLDSGEQLEWAQARAIARCARPAIEPVPVSERPWERDGWCDAEGKCWFYRPAEIPCRLANGTLRRWVLDTPCRDGDPVHDTHSLPHHALPVPAAVKDEPSL